MSRETTIQLTLSDDAALFVRSQIASGEYASESEVILDGIEALRQIADERHGWEREVLLPAYDRMMADPALNTPIDQVERNLEMKRRERQARR